MRLHNEQPLRTIPGSLNRRYRIASNVNNEFKSNLSRSFLNIGNQVVTISHSERLRHYRKFNCGYEKGYPDNPHHLIGRT